jgi:hypothetical protein
VQCSAVRHTYVLAVYRADEEDDELEDAEHEPVLRGGGPLPLRLQRETRLATAWRATAHNMCAALPCTAFVRNIFRHYIDIHRGARGSVVG